MYENVNEKEPTEKKEKTFSFHLESFINRLLPHFCLFCSILLSNISFHFASIPFNLCVRVCVCVQQQQQQQKRKIWHKAHK